MGFRFRKSVKILPGVKLNLSKSGVSTSIGGKGATLNLSSKGKKATLGIPGTGLSYQAKTIKNKKTNNVIISKNGSESYYVENSQANKFIVFIKFLGKAVLLVIGFIVLMAMLFG